MIFSLRITMALYFASPASAPVYFGRDFQRSVEQLQQYDTVFTRVANQYHTDAELMKAIVFPEFIRYAYLSDLMETLALEQLYAQYGSYMADFSIGQCQMKPSFAEDIEQRALHYPAYAQKIKSLKITAGASSRKQRIERLKDMNWQITYLAMFVQMACDKFNGNNLPREEKLRMLATVYNRGMNQQPQRIQQLTRARAFPNGSREGASPYAYSDISLLYLKLLKAKP